MDKYKKLASNTIILAIGQFSSKLLVIIMTRFYTQILGDTGYGAINLIHTSSMLLMSIITLSIGESTIRFGLDEKTNKSQVFSISIFTNIAGLIIFIPFVPLLGLVMDNIMLIYIYIVTASIRSTCAFFVRSTGHVKLFAFDGIFNTVVNIIFNIILLQGFKLGVMGYALAVVFADLVSIIFLFYLADLKRYFHVFGLDKHLRRAMYRFCIPMIPTSVMWWITNASDNYFIKEMISEGALGVYNVSYKLPNTIALISGLFSQAWNMSAITEKNSRTVAKFYTDVFNFYSSVIYVIAAAIFLVLKPMLHLLAPREEFADAFRYTPLLITAVVFSCFQTFMGSVYIALKKPMRSMITVSSGAVLNLILNFILIPMLGLYGAALATAISYILVFTVRAIDIRPFVYMDLKPIKMATNLILLTGMGTVVMFIQDGFLYYLVLFILFLLIAVLNYRAGTTALKFIFKNKKAREH